MTDVIFSEITKTPVVPAYLGLVIGNTLRMPR